MCKIWNVSETAVAQNVRKYAFYLVCQLKAMKKKKSASSEMFMNMKHITVFDIHKML